MVNTILLLLSVMMTQQSAQANEIQTTEFPWPQLSMKCYPETVMPGDTLYVLVEAKNPYDKSVFISDTFRPVEGDIRIRFFDSKKQVRGIPFESDISALVDYLLILTEIKPGKMRMIGALSLIIPPLEDLHEPFWEKELKGVPPEGSELLFQVSVFYRSYASDFPKTEEELQAFLEKPVNPEDLLRYEIILEQKTIFLKPRQPAEMAMIEKWYADILEKLFARLKSRFRIYPEQFARIFESKIISIQNEVHSKWHFIRLGNRYPCEPNAPETWQGWKELEDSLTPSTMRDEIRLTRILIQYCDTQDPKVLDELKEWFAEMNEVQRICMAKSICDRARGCYGTDLLVPFRDLYKTIRGYDIAAKSESEIEWLKKLELLE